MTILEMFKTCTADEIAEKYGKYVEKLDSGGVSNGSPWMAFDWEYFEGTNECPEDCPHLGEGVYGDGEVKVCYLKAGEYCPADLNLVKNTKKQFIEWLNTDISKGDESV